MIGGGESADDTLRNIVVSHHPPTPQTPPPHPTPTKPPNQNTTTQTQPKHNVFRISGVKAMTRCAISWPPLPGLPSFYRCHLAVNCNTPCLLRT
ncbi:hypothetical protein J6590_047250 [Homalodisca vitripennis]|nr:hypothetical protein J6590_047250 [Homalodisca vitripennis]